VEDAKLRHANDIGKALQAVGELLAVDDFRFGIVVIGGAALNLLGVVDRATRDVDVVAVTEVPGHPEIIARPPSPLPAALTAAITQVARDFELPENWMNTGPAGQWDVGFLQGFAARITWTTYGGLDVGLADRLDLICFKLDAAADQPTSNSRHFRDLVALNPSDREIGIASEWVHEQNVGVEHHTIIDRVVAHVTSLRK
jgi:hypothetical protein